MPKVWVKRGTRAQLNAAATANNLAAGELYLITDEGALAVGTSPSSYSVAAMDGFAAPGIAITGDTAGSQDGVAAYNEAKTSVAIGGDATVPPGYRRAVAIGGSVVSAEGCTGVGYGADVRGEYNTAIGARSATQDGIVRGTAIGAGATVGAVDYASGTPEAGTESVVSVGSADPFGTYGEFQSRIANVAPGVFDHDAVNIAQLNAVAVPKLNFGETMEKWTGEFDYSEPDKPRIYHRWFSWGAMPNATGVTKPHGILNMRKAISRSGVAIPSSGGGGFNINFTGATVANSVSLNSGTTDITLTTGSNRTAMTAWVYLTYTCTNR